MTETAGVDLQDEWYFKKWFKAWAQRTGVSRDPDYKDNKYDYRAAWKAKANPIWDEEKKKWEWQPEFSYEKPEAGPAPQYELALTINGVKLVPQQVEEQTENGV